ncbi:uncharacterized protein LOC102801624, partial [Saccoglossus kowalevskii]|uniref:Uncharacterized protein LOC102801624 n=1 Tax=Saccoglossus kowalevskii TaxID=10224 RepID=A0ABM0MWK4_SACKO
METVSVTLTERFQYERNRQRIVRSLENMGITQPERRRRSKGYKRASELLSRNGSSISLKGDSGRRDSTLTVTSPALGLRKGSLIGNGNDMNDMLTRKGSIQGGGVTTLILQTRRRSDEKLRRKRLAQNQRRLLLQKFIMVGKLIGFMFRLCKKHFHVADSTDSAVMYGMGDGNSETELLFDLSSFKAQKQSKVTQEAKRILKMEPRERTEREIYHVQVALRNVESIACYPVTMHRKLSKVGWYQCFEAKRLILRQGYEPINYYFILSGSAVLSEFDVEEDKSRVVSILNKGESFG